MNKKGINKSYLLFCFLLFLVAISYSNTLYSPFILDDYSAFINNKNLYLEDFTFASLAKLAKTRFGYARIIPIGSFALNHYIGQGKSIVNYHVTNILIHLLATVSVAFFMAGLLKTKAARNSLRFLRTEYFILGVCGLWALSPIQTNAVTYLVQRMTSMAAMFYIAACGFYVHARLARMNWQRIILFISFLLAAIFGFFSKENSGTLPVAILLIEFMFISPDLGSKLLKSIRWYHWLIIIAGLALVLPFIENFIRGMSGGFYGRHFTVSERMMTELRIVIFYMSLLILPLPSRMNLDHDFSLSASLFSPPQTFFALLFIVGLLGAGFHYRKKYPIISFGIFWYFLNLVIESSFIPLELIFEHRVYLPSVGFFMALVYLMDQFLYKFASDSHPEIKKIVFLLIIIILSVSSVLTSLRNNDWRDRLSLYRDSMEKSPAKPRAVSNYAMALGKDGQLDKCVEYGIKVQSLGEKGYEDFMNAAANTLTCLLMQEKHGEAIVIGEQLRNQVLQKNLEYIGAGALHKYMSNLARAYSEEKQYRKAFDTFQISLFRAPSEIETYLAINRLLLYAQEDEQGREELNIGEEIYQVPIHLAKIAFNYRQYDFAAKYLQDAIRLGATPEIIKPFEEKLTQTIKQNRQQAQKSNIANNPTYKNNSEFRFYIKAVDFILRKYKPLRGAPAGWLLNQAQKIDPENPFIPVYRARWLLANNKADIAIQELEKKAVIYNNFVPILELLGISYQEKKNYEKSVSIFSHILDIYPGYRQWSSYLSYIYQYEDSDNEKKRSPLDYY